MRKQHMKCGNFNRKYLPSQLKEEWLCKAED